MWAQSFDCHVEVTWIGQSFTENGDSFATITNIWEAKKMWLLCLKDVVMTGFLTVLPALQTAPLVSIFVQNRSLQAAIKLRVWNSSIKSTCHVTSCSEFQRDPFTLNGPRDTGPFIGGGSDLRVHVVPAAPSNKKKLSWHRLFHPQGTPSEWWFTEVLSSICFCPVEACWSKILHVWCTWLVLEPLTWPHLPNLFLKLYVKIWSNLQAKQQTTLRNFGLLSSKLSKQIPPIPTLW